MTKFTRNPYGAIRIAFKLSIIRKKNLWFSTLFGGGALYPSGEDSLFIRDMLKSGMKVYISNKTIGYVNADKSTWFTGMNEKFFWGNGVFIQASLRGILRFLYPYYFALRTVSKSELSFSKKIKLMRQGMRDYKIS